MNLGQILIGDLRTGDFVQHVAPTGRLAAGMKYDSRSNLLFVAGGPSGRGTVYNASSGAEITFYQFQPPNTSGINDVVLTRHAAYFTTSPILYRVALGPRGKPSENFGKPCARNGPRCRSGALLTRAAPRAIISASTSDRPRRARSGMTGIPSTKSPFIRLSVPSLHTKRCRSARTRSNRMSST
jgi:hypothetical protein